MMKRFYDVQNLRGDLIGGLVAGIVALPLALAFGEQTHLGAIAGLYGAIALGIFAAILGGTKTQISGPTAPMTVVSAVIIAEAIEWMGSLEAAIPIIIAGLRNAAVMNIGIAAIAAYIGAGGLGVFIQQGIARAYEDMIMAGAVLVALLAIVVDGGMSLLERVLTPKGIKIKKSV